MKQMSTGATLGSGFGPGSGSGLGLGHHLHDLVLRDEARHPERELGALLQREVGLDEEEPELPDVDGAARLAVAAAQGQHEGEQRPGGVENEHLEEDLGVLHHGAALDALRTEALPALAVVHVGENVERRANLVEHIRGLRARVLVRVQLERARLVRLLDVSLARVAIHTQEAVVVGPLFLELEPRLHGRHRDKERDGQPQARRLAEPPRLEEVPRDGVHEEDIDEEVTETLDVRHGGPSLSPKPNPRAHVEGGPRPRNPNPNPNPKARSLSLRPKP
mmetsp:Transcript_9961/g.29307  ORF Transcript_9961/g.29307 Transcript_9961/m.29307 type:complete len:277 (-) Transcript_9961:22-852(-)